MIQLSLFESDVVKESRLIADSPRVAFYNLALVFENGSYFVRKESGTKGKVLDGCGSF